MPTVRNRAMNNNANCAQQTSENYCQLWAREQWKLLPTVSKRAVNSTVNCAQHSN